MPIGGERAAVQNPLLRYAEEAGWTVLCREEALDRRRDSRADRFVKPVSSEKEQAA